MYVTRTSVKFYNYGGKSRLTFPGFLDVFGEYPALIIKQGKTLNSFVEEAIQAMVSDIFSGNQVRKIGSGG